MVLIPRQLRWASNRFIETIRSAIANRPMQCSVSVEILSYCCTNNAHRSPHVSLRSMFSNCHVLFDCRQSSLQQTQLSHSEHSMPCVSSTDFQTTNLVDVNWTVTMIIKHSLPPKLLMTLRIPPPPHHHGRGSLLDGHKFSVVRRMNRRLVDRSKNAILPTPPAFGTPVGGDPSQLRDLLHYKARVPGLSCNIVSWNPTYSCFDTIPACDERMDRRTCDDST